MHMLCHIMQMISSSIKIIIIAISYEEVIIKIS